MCRLYGFRATEPTKVECSLAYSQNNLLLQSRSDERGMTHAHGWGLGYYSNHEPHVERSAGAAFETVEFYEAAARAYACTIVAHVRRATVGEPGLSNTHPFTYSFWTFAHNGTVTGFDSISSRLQEETLPLLRESRRGTTDSETLFLWLLSRWVTSGHDLENQCDDPRELARVVGRSLRELASECQRAAPDRTPRLNTVLTDGSTMIASRFNHSLSWVARRGLHDCEICGVPHVHHDEGTPYQAVVVASEPISDEAWTSLDDPSLICINANLRVETLPL